MEIRQHNQCQHRERLINRRAQGDLGEFSAMEWLASKGALVWIPLGHSPDAELMAEANGRVIRIQVKTSTQRLATPRGDERWGVNLATNGGNQSWSGTTKEFDPTDVDFLFALVGEGRRWFVPAAIVEGARGITLGGSKYSEFEVERGTPIESLVYSSADGNTIGSELGECLSGQKELAVNESAFAYAGSNPASPIHDDSALAIEIDGDVTRSERKLARSGHCLLRHKRQTTIPKRPCAGGRVEGRRSNASSSRRAGPHRP